MKRHLIMMGLHGMAAMCAFAQEEAFSVKPIQYTFILPSAVGEPFYIKPPGAPEMAGCVVTYLMTGEAIMPIDCDAITIDSITDKDGKDMSKDTRGRESWKLCRTPMVSKDGKFATFEVFVPSDTGMVIPTVKGMVTLLSANASETTAFQFKTDGSDAEQKAGVLAVSIMKGEVSARDFRVFGRNGGKLLGVCVKGDTKRLPELTVLMDGKPLTWRGSSYSNNKTTYYYDVGAAMPPEVTVKATHVTEQKEVKVPFGNSHAVRIGTSTI